MIRPAVCAAALACALAATPASAAWMAHNGLIVEGGPEDITVHATAGRGSSQIICAAADYAVERLGAEPSHRVTITRPSSGRIDGVGGEKVGFRLTTDAEIDHGIFVRASRAGTTVKVAHGQTMCGDSRD